MFFVVVDGVLLAKVNKTLRVATPGSEGECTERISLFALTVIVKALALALG